MVWKESKIETSSTTPRSYPELSKYESIRKLRGRVTLLKELGGSKIQLNAGLAGQVNLMT